MRDKWSDERMDDVNRRVDSGFNRVGTDLREVRSEIGGLREEMSSRFAHVDARFDALQHTMLQVAAGMFATLAIGFAGIIATQL